MRYPTELYCLFSYYKISLKFYPLYPFRYHVDKLLTIAEVCERLRLTPQTIYKMIKDKTLPAIRVGAQWRIPEDKIQEWLDAQAHNFSQEEL